MSRVGASDGLVRSVRLGHATSIRESMTQGDGAGFPTDKGQAARAHLDLVFSAAYDELRRLAAQVRAGDPSATLSPTALVNEAWFKLSASPEVAQTSKVHFKRIAARAMRQILVEAARRRQAEKRGSGTALVTFDEDLVERSTSDDVLQLNEALEKLESISPRQAELVEARFFGGLDVRETAELLAISEATVQRDWRTARAWLASTLRTP